MAQRDRNILLLHAANANLHQIQLMAAHELLRRRRALKKKPKPREIWVRPLFQKRGEWGCYYTLLQHMAREESDLFKSFLRVDPATFRDLVARLRPRIEKKTTNFRHPLEAEQRLMVALRYYATGEAYRGLRFVTVIAHNTISKLVVDVSEAIIDTMVEEFMPFPSTTDAWNDIATKFEERWQFPHGLGAIDGKHVRIVKPRSSGSIYFNYKGYFSIVLMAMVDAEYKFIWTQIGNNGAASDAQIFLHSDLYRDMANGELNVPPPQPLPKDDRDMPYYFIGDDAFALKTWLMKPFSIRFMSRPERIYNYRVSRARRVVENAFGILAQRFQCVLQGMRQTPENVSTIVQALCILHNYLRTKFPVLNPREVDQDDADGQLVPGAWRQEVDWPDVVNRARNPRNEGQIAKDQRIYLMNYFNSTAGSVSWQWDMI